MGKVAVLASSIKPGIRVIYFSQRCGIPPVVKGEYSIAIIAPFIGCCVVTVEKMLLRKGNKVASVVTFEGTNGRKGPAGATASLILERVTALCSLQSMGVSL